MAGLQYFDITIPPGQTREVPCEGTYFRFYQGSAGGNDAGLLVKSDTGAVVSILYPGQSLKLPDSVRLWKLANYKGAGTISGIVVIGDGEIQDTTIAGTVSMVDGGKARTAAGSAFSGSVYCPQSAGNYAHVGAWNPAGSGKNCFIESIAISGAVAQSFNIRAATVQLTTPVGMASKKISGTASATVSGTQGLPAVQNGGALLYNGYIQASANLVINFREPVLLPPGNGIVVMGYTITTGDLSGNFEFFEEPI